MIAIVRDRGNAEVRRAVVEVVVVEGSCNKIGVYEVRDQARKLPI